MNAKKACPSYEKEGKWYYEDEYGEEHELKAPAAASPAPPRVSERRHGERDKRLDELEARILRLESGGLDKRVEALEARIPPVKSGRDKRVEELEARILRMESEIVYLKALVL
jgi:hypothetical protein